MKLPINIKLATDWNQLTKKQLRGICLSLELYRQCPDVKQTQDIQLYIRLIKNLLRSNNFIKVWIALRQIPPEEYREHVKFLLEGIHRTQFLPSIEIKNTRYYAPANRLSNITIEEFSFVDSLWYFWREKKDNRYLDLLCAALYRKPAQRIRGNEEDVRVPFRKNYVEKTVRVFKNLEYKQKLAIAYTYEGSRNHITKQFPHVFPPAPTLSDEEKELRKRNPKPARYTPMGKLVDHKIDYDPSKKRLVMEMNANEFLQTYENELIEMKNQKK